MTGQKQSIGEDRVATLLDVYGADPDAWPLEQRRAAVARIAGSPALQQAQRSARELDGLIEKAGSGTQATRYKSVHRARAFCDDYRPAHQWRQRRRPSLHGLDGFSRNRAE